VRGISGGIMNYLRKFVFGVVRWIVFVIIYDSFFRKLFLEILRLFC
jgi:hypothetical protein